ncbi:CheR family methyltransferase, partial [Planktothrix sp.]
DRSAWDYVKDEIILRILANKEPNEAIRIWSAGCASGEEAYTISMMVAEVVGIDQFRERVKIYATDIDEEALGQARQAIYLQKDLTGLSSEQIEQFFEKIDTHYTFRKDLRRCVIFGRHDLLQDAPISKIDLLVCRNTLMYFNAEAQSRILARFHFALRDSGFLFLGKAEMLLTHAHTFTPTDLKCRVFAKVPKLNLRDRLLIMAQTGNEEAANHLSSLVRLRELAFDSGPCARIIIDTNGLLALANERARFLFNLTSRDVGRPLQDLEISYRPIELRSCIEQAYSEKQPVNIRDIEWQMASGDIIFINIQVCPLLDPNNQALGISINFMDVTRYKNLQED